MTMKASKNAYALITKFESCCLKAYRCPAGVPTIGFGHTSGVKMGDTVTMEKALQLLEEDVTVFARSLEKVLDAIEAHINQNQFDALVSFVFNIGMGNFMKSTMFDLLEKNESPEVIAKEFAKWNKARQGGRLVELKGLTKRRSAEKELFLTPVYMSDV